MMDSYHSIDAVNWSTLKHMRESALAYKYRLDVPIEETPSLLLGRALHTLVFEPEKFSRDYAIWENGRRYGKEWNEFQKDHASQTILRAEDIDLATAMAEAVRRHPLVQPYLKGGIFEQSIAWTDKETGLRCKAKPDWILSRQKILIDLKSAVCIDARRFGAAAARYGYHCQLAHYRSGLIAAGWEIQRVLIITVEKEPPHDVALFELDQEALYAGAEEVAELLRKLKHCRDTNTWPGRYTEEQALQLPAWMFMDDEEDPESFGLVVGE